jgi:hypothetical protein
MNPPEADQGYGRPSVRPGQMNGEELRIVDLRFKIADCGFS